MAKRVLVAMSGGIDSSVAAFLLQQRGFDVAGVTMYLNIKTSNKKRQCCSEQAIDEAKNVCSTLGISHYVMDFSSELEEKVIAKFISEYLKGRTPNPCIECNRFLKFGLLLKKAKVLGFDFLATGHYAGIEEENGKFVLKKAKDKRKDQSYFLYPIKKETLGSILFPLARLTKEKVRQIARRANLPTTNKPQSQDICFVSQGDYREFIRERVGEIKWGEIVDLKGNICGRHKGIPFYTIGQREKIGLTSKEPLYVVSIDGEKNQIVVGRKENLIAKGLIAGNLNLLVDNLPEDTSAKVRYTHKEGKCKIFLEGEKAKVIFKETQEAITPGQSVVFYTGEIILGGGIIERVIPALDS